MSEYPSIVDHLCKANHDPSLRKLVNEAFSAGRGSLASTVAEQASQIERLREENDKLREISLRRFIGCMCNGSFENGVLVPSQWHWSCLLCGAESVSDNDTENLEHKADCPIRWIRETGRRGELNGGGQS